MESQQLPAPLIGPLLGDRQVIALWLGTVSAGSRRVYRATVAEFQEAVGLPLAGVRLEDLAAWFDRLGGAPNTRRRKQMTVKSLLSFCHRTGYLPFNVGGPLPAQKAPQNLARRILPREELLQIINAAEGDARQILEFLYETGVRASELTHLRWYDLQSGDDGFGQANVLGKGDKTRSVLLSAGLYARLHARRGAPGGYVFTGQRGGRMDQSDLWKLVRAAARRAGIGEAVSAHWFRHACASHAIAAGAPLHLVQQQLGHTSLAVTGRYLHARPQDGLCCYLSLDGGGAVSGAAPKSGA